MRPLQQIWPEPYMYQRRRRRLPEPQLPWGWNPPPPMIEPPTGSPNLNNPFGPVEPRPPPGMFPFIRRPKKPPLRRIEAKPDEFDRVLHPGLRTPKN
jgi:hypothetical protein